jgi:alpha-galactosidase
VGIFNHARNKEAIPAGWCSWYEYFEKPSEEIILTNLGVIDKWKKHLPLKIVQLDDGFQTAWGDWHGALPRFPKGLAPLSAAIAEKGFTPGLWLAPVSIDKFSKLLKANPKWALKKGSSFAHCGFNNRFAAGLDITMPQVQQYLKELISSAVTMWGMRYLKLDFLYACIALGDRYDMTMTRAEAMQIALSIIRQAAGEETYILGCGCPQGSGIGYVDSMRVSADAGPSWFPDFPFQNDKNNHPGCRNSVRNTINKMSMHRRWWVNDPDCMLIRNTTKITFDELKGIGTVTALSGGSFFISDRLDTLSEERLQFAQRFMPISGVAGVVHDVLGQEMPEIISLSNLCDQVGDWSLLGVCNWGDHSANKSVDISKLLNSLIPLGSTTKYVHVYEFWTETYTLHAIRDTHLRTSAPIPSHSAFLYSIRPFFNDKASYVGSNIHFTMGTEVKDWDATFGRVVLHLHKHKVLEKDFFVKVYIPGDPVTSVKVSGDAARCTEGIQDKSNLSIWKILVGCSMDNVALNRVEVMW